jgi:GH15 family glucan-1,4-alpha-glucosidase
LTSVVRDFCLGRRWHVANVIGAYLLKSHSKNTLIFAASLSHEQGGVLRMEFFAQAGALWLTFCNMDAASLSRLALLDASVATLILVLAAAVIAATIALLGAVKRSQTRNPTTVVIDPPAPKRTPIVTGNGFGFAVLATTGEVTKLYAHPYRFERPNADVTQDGDLTANFVSHLAWSTAQATASGAVTYVNESHVASVKEAAAEQFYFMPFGLSRNVLIATRYPAASDPSLCLRATWQHAIQREETVVVNGRNVRTITFQGVKESLALLSLDGANAKIDNSNILPGSAWAFIVLEDAAQLEAAVQEVLQWQNGTAAQALAEREVQSHEEWRIPPSVGFANENERKLWRQSETVLRMSQSREPNTAARFNYGSLVASLPDGVFFIPWVRDMAYATVALIRMGHLDEARKALLFYFNARPVGRMRHETRGYDYQISVVRYFGDGSEEADYSGMPTPNVELDDWGLVLWAVSEYVRNTSDVQWLTTPTYRGSVYESMRDLIVHPLLGNLLPYGEAEIVTADSSLWEESQANKRQHIFSTISAINGLRGFEQLATDMHDQGTVNLVADQLKVLERGFVDAFVRNNELRGTVEDSFKNEIDGSCLEAFNFFIVTDRSIIDRTMQKMELLKTASGGYRRVRGDSNYEKQEFLFINFMMVRLNYRLARTADANQMLTRMVEKACLDNCLIPEMYVSEKNSEFVGEIGDPTGAIPMVGYGAGAYIVTLTERDGRW